MANLPLRTIEPSKFWAIPLTDSKHRKWDQSTENSKLKFQWEEISISGKSTLNTISIAVAKYYHNDSIRSIEDISSAIYNYSRIKKGHGIIGFTADLVVKKAGIVNWIEEDSMHSISAEIQWLATVHEENDLPIVSRSSEIEPISKKNVRKIFPNLPFIPRSDENTADFKNIFESSEPIDSQNEIGSVKDDKGGEIQLFYGTNRNKTGSLTPNEYYGEQLSNLTLGTCTVNLPKGHIQGVVERPNSFWILELPEKIEKHIVLKSIKAVGQQEFANWISNGISNLNEKSAMVFIHGYNVTFAEAAHRTAQIAWDIPFNGLAGFFSWPSSGKLISYAADIEKADSSIPAFETFLQLLTNQTGIEKLHLIAHSMGNRLLTLTLTNLSFKGDFSEKLKIINQIVLGAPDLDQDVFNNTILPIFKNIGERRTLYSSDKDEALKKSKIIRGGRPRLGDCGRTMFVAKELDTIDASNVPSNGNNHSYIFETKELLSDLYYLLGKGFGPVDRRLRAVDKKNLKYWLFPK